MKGLALQDILTDVHGYVHRGMHVVKGCGFDKADMFVYSETSIVGRLSDQMLVHVLNSGDVRILISGVHTIHVTISIG